LGRAETTKKRQTIQPSGIGTIMASLNYRKPGKASHFTFLYAHTARRDEERNLMSLSPAKGA
jgi:hypothetical protein